MGHLQVAHPSLTFSGFCVLSVYIRSVPTALSRYDGRWLLPPRCTTLSISAPVFASMKVQSMHGLAEGEATSGEQGVP